jgi:C4-dicarboxylate transporter, DctQ subunit
MADPGARRSSSLGRLVNALEEGIIALLFAAMTIVTFSQVVARYVFNTGAVWALELTTYLFAWLVLFGMSYGVKVGAHLGVDAFVRLFGPGPRRILGLLAVAAGLIYGGILLIGSWDYVSKLYMIGIESEDLPIPQWLPMAILPIGVALLMLRLAQVGMRVWTRQQEGLLLGDETADAFKEHLDDLAEGTAVVGGPKPGPAPRGLARRPTS